MQSKLVLGCAFVLSLAALCATQSVRSSGSSEDEAAVRAADAKWRKAVAGYDLTRTLAAYTDDAIMMQPGTPAATGKPALRQAWHKLMNDNFFVLTWSITEVQVSGDLACTRGPYNVTFSIENRDIFDQVGKYVVIWKKIGKDWKVATEIYNDDGPPTPHKK